MKIYLQISTKYSICHQKMLGEVLFFFFFSNEDISILVCNLGSSMMYSILEQILRNYKFSVSFRLLYNLVC